MTGIPLTQAQKNRLRALGFPDEYMPHFTAEEGAKLLHSIKTPEKMRQFLNDGRVSPKSDDGERFLAAFESDTTPPSKPDQAAPEPSKDEPAHDDQERESPDEAPVTGAESFVPKPHVCVHCKLDPPDGTERALGDGNWIHPRCENAYIRVRSAEEGFSQEDASTKPNGGNHPSPNIASDINTHTVT